MGLFQENSKGLYMIELKKITKIYESKKKVKTIALDDVSLKIA